MLSMTVLTRHMFMHCLKIFKPSVMGASWNRKENNTKINALLKKHSFQKMLFENPVLLHT